jgi:hypothetical protein
MDRGCIGNDLGVDVVGVRLAHVGVVLLLHVVRIDRRIRPSNLLGSPAARPCA